MKLRNVVAASGLLMAALVLPTKTVDAEPQFVMNFGTVAPEGTPWADQVKDTKVRIERDSNGAIYVKTFLNGVLGGEVEMTRDIRRGERLQAGGMSTAAVAQGANVPILELPELPYLFRTDQEADAVLDDVLFKPTSEALNKKGFVLGFWAINGWRSFATRGGPATTLDELQAYRMRSQEAPVHIAMWKALGVQAVTKPTSEVLSAINTGIVDGFDNTPLFSLASGWIEPMSHYTLSRHIHQPAAIVYSKRFYDKLPPDLQAVIMGDPKVEADKGRTGVRQLEQEMLSTIAEMGTTVVPLNDAQRKVFEDATRSVHAEFLSLHPELEPVYAQVQTRLKAMR
jgi:TRAP-type C4-dicarboxylate transport system substrate-binding protein